MGSVIILVALYGISLFTADDCDKALELKTPGISILWGHFGYSQTCTRRFMERNQYIQIHPSFHAYQARQSTRHRAGIYKLCRSFPGVTCIVSLGLEDKYRPTERNKAARAFSRGKPKNVFLSSNSTICTTCRTRNVKYLETHTDRPSRGFQIASNDGWGIRFKGKTSGLFLREILANIKASKGLKIYALWYGEGQGISKPEDRKIEPWKRKPGIRKAHVREINQAF